MDDKVSKGRQHRGEATGGVALTEVKVVEILMAYATGEFSAMALANEYLVSEATIRSVVNGETWTHVPGPRLSRDEIVKMGKEKRAAARIQAKAAAGWPPGACRICRRRGHYAKTCAKRAPVIAA
jgi:DNA repair protein RadC